MDTQDKITGEEFAARLDKLVTDFNEEVVKLVHASQASRGLNIDTNEALPFAEDNSIEEQVDRIACIAGWIADRLCGRNRLHKKSLTKKIRRVLGYTYP